MVTILTNNEEVTVVSLGRIVCAIGCLFITSSKSVGDDSRLQSHLSSIWAGERSAIVNGQFRLQLLRPPPKYTRALPHDEVHELLDAQDISRNGLKDLVTSLCKKGTYIASIELVVEGGDAREVLTNGANEVVMQSAARGDTRVFTKQSSTNSQATISRDRNLPAPLRLSDIRYVPPVPFDWSRFSIEEFKDVDSKIKLVATDGLTSCVVDKRLGFAYHVARFANRESTAPFIEFLQYDPIEYSSASAVLPSVSLRLFYQNGKLYRFVGIALEEARLNEDLSTDAFTVSVPKGTVIVDERRPEEGRKISYSQQPVSDVADWVENPSPPARNRRWLWVNLVIVLLLLAAVAALRRRKSNR